MSLPQVGLLFFMSLKVTGDDTQLPESHSEKAGVCIEQAGF